MNFNEPFWLLLPSSNQETGADGKGSQSFAQCPVQIGAVNQTPQAKWLWAQSLKFFQSWGDGSSVR